MVIATADPVLIPAVKPPAIKPRIRLGITAPGTTIKAPATPGSTMRIPTGQNAAPNPGALLCLILVLRNSRPGERPFSYYTSRTVSDSNHGRPEVCHTGHLEAICLVDPLAVSRTGQTVWRPTVSGSRICQYLECASNCSSPVSARENLPRHCSRCVAGSKQVSDFSSGVPAQSPARQPGC